MPTVVTDKRQNGQLMQVNDKSLDERCTRWDKEKTRKDSKLDQHER